ncbi:hypothetical protein [Streptomyces sp. MNP-20]|uniref:hypothetical protein n=1 Tax=Streptomyces sp. MNP-20 TaxID=2721165 RepID=UPI001552BC91|nr:hypothetical protein [Streptomyces sp. MNP-20]
MAYYGEIEAPEAQIDPRWTCHHCGTTGDDEDGMNAATYVTDDTERYTPTPVWVYWRPYCEACLPRPATVEFPPDWSLTNQVPEWRAYRTTAGDRQLALQHAVERHGTLRATVAGALYCSVCKKRWTTGRLDETAVGLVYAAEADRDESPCLECIDRLPEAEVQRAHRARSVAAR